MALIPPSNLVVGSLAAGGTPAIDARDWLHELADGARRLTGADVRELVTIVGGAITPSRMIVRVDTEAAAASDDLTTIVGTNLPEGSLLEIYTADDSRAVVVKHGTTGAGHIFLHGGQDLTLSSSSMRLHLQRIDADRWIERMRDYGTNVAGHRAWLGLGASATKAIATTPQAQAGVADTVMTAATTKVALDHGPLVIGSKTELTTGLAADQFFLVLMADGTLRKISMDTLRWQFNEPRWQSGLLAIATPVVLTTHGQNVEVEWVEAVLVCIGDDLGYSATINGGAKMLLRTDDTSGGSGSRTVSIGYDNNDVWALLPPDGIRLRHKTTGVQNEIDPAKWRLRFRVWT